MISASSKEEKKERTGVLRSLVKNELITSERLRESKAKTSRKLKARNLDLIQKNQPRV